jgi:hypothetical protein
MTIIFLNRPIFLNRKTMENRKPPTENEAATYQPAVELFTCDGATGELPQSVANWAGLDSTSPTTPAGRSLVAMNDFKGAGFFEIADIIEECF